jgi:inorganic triphosphatase YgiF
LERGLERRHSNGLEANRRHRVHLTDEQRQANVEKAAARKAQAEAAFEKAVKLWKTAPKADGNHQYLVKKGLRDHTTGIFGAYPVYV